jgi:hypothetical protein
VWQYVIVPHFLDINPRCVISNVFHLRPMATQSIHSSNRLLPATAEVGLLSHAEYKYGRGDFDPVLIVELSYNTKSTCFLAFVAALARRTEPAKNHLAKALTELAIDSLTISPWLVAA